MSGDYYRWDLPAEGWSKSEFRDDTLKVVFESGDWWGQVEREQCVHRDLSPDEILSIRKEFGL